MHNKSFTVDNQISVFGGRNIGDEYFDVNEKMNFAIWMWLPLAVWSMIFHKTLTVIGIV